MTDGTLMTSMTSIIWSAKMTGMTTITVLTG